MSSIPGRVAGFGDITIGQTDEIPPAVVRSFIYLEPGDPYSPKALADTRKSIATIPAVGSVRIREADKLDAHGNLPIFVDVTERPKRAGRLLGRATRRSTARQCKTYWEHRNLFGGAERLRLEGRHLPGAAHRRHQDPELRRFRAIRHRRPLRRQLPEAGAGRQPLRPPDRRARDARAGRHRPLRRLYRPLRQRHHRDPPPLQRHLLGPGRCRGREGPDQRRARARSTTRWSASRSRCTTIRPTACSIRRAVSARIAIITPYPTFLGSTVGIDVRPRATVSTYYSLDEDARYILAARVGFGVDRRGEPRRDPGDVALLCRRRRLGARLSLPQPRPARSLRPRRSADAACSRLPGGAHQDHRHHRYRPLRRCRQRPSGRVSGLQADSCNSGRSRPALLHGHRPDPPRRGGSAQPAPGRQARRRSMSASGRPSDAARVLRCSP